MSAENDTTWYCARCLSTFRTDESACPNLGCSRPRPASGWGRMYGPGELLDRTYRITRQLALGGAGVTYLAREVTPEGEETGPLLAIKVLFATRDEGSYLRRLATEAQILQELDHPNIVEYLGFVHRAGHSPYLVTRFEEGGSLLDHMRRVGTLPLRQSAQVGRQVCWALEKAEEAGIVHRDLKPENLLIARPVTGEEVPVVRVADFGIAKVQSGLGSGLTRVGAFVGTPNYAAPELFVGREPTSATDVYGVGALLYFCLTAKTVVKFADRLAPEDGYQLLVDSLPPVAAREGEDEDELGWLNEILARSMGVDPDHRCTLSELDGMLGALAAGREPTWPDVKPAAGPKPLLDVGDTYSPETTETQPHRSGDTVQAVRAAATNDSLEDATAPLPQAKTPPPPPRGSSGGGAMAAVAGLLVVGLVVVVAAAGLVWWQAPELLGMAGTGSSKPLPIELTGKESDPALLADYRGVMASVHVIEPAIARACDVPTGTQVDARLVVEPDGKAREAELVGDSAGAASACVHAALMMATYKRSGKRPARVALQLAW